jgi:hypothetical protein
MSLANFNGEHGALLRPPDLVWFRRDLRAWIMQPCTGRSPNASKCIAFLSSTHDILAPAAADRPARGVHPGIAGGAGWGAANAEWPTQRRPDRAARGSRQMPVPAAGTQRWVPRMPSSPTTTTSPRPCNAIALCAPSWPLPEVACTPSRTIRCWSADEVLTQSARPTACSRRTRTPGCARINAFSAEKLRGRAPRTPTGAAAARTHAPRAHAGCDRL